MSIKTLTIITEPHKVFNTGKKPVLVTCNDLKYYICKHNFALSSSLFNEYIASSFLRIWNIPTPKYVLIDAPQEYVREFSIENCLQPNWFIKSCFGSYLLQYAKELDDFILNIKKDQLNKLRKVDFLKIALFDIWIANEDRTAGHTNILINPEQDGWLFYAIDHDNCFNSNSGQDLYQLNENDTIMAHELFRLMFKKKNIDHGEIIENIFADFTIIKDNCVSNLKVILDNIPKNWNLDTNEKERFLRNNLFSDTWIKETKKTFQSFYLKYKG